MGNHSHQHSHCCHCHHDEHCTNNGLLPLILGIILFSAAIISNLTLEAKPLTIALFVSSYLLLGANVLKNTVGNIRSLRFFDENTLMTIATIGAFAIGEYAEAT